MFHLPLLTGCFSITPIVPASFFGIVLGLAGLGGSWRVAHRLWGLPAVVGEMLMLAAAATWALLLVLYVTKWLLARQDALREVGDPIQCCFIGLVGVATMLIALAVLPYSRVAAIILFAVGALFTLSFAVWRTGGLWHGGRDDSTTTPVLYLPTVAGAFVTANTAAALGFPDWGQLAFGAGAFSWLAIESVLLHRLYMAPTLPLALRPTLGIQLAPPAVGAMAYLGVTTGPPHLLAHAPLGYGLLQALVLLRLLPWIREQHFVPSYWAFSFGATALSTATLAMVERGDAGAVVFLAVPIFVSVNCVIGALIIGTLRLAMQHRLQPKPL
ncbi:MAG TPA: dicarboxylate transporter/tellurite-resistance protein TehA [Abditibacteriaceae bacterium]|jgi:tellurite resistance protein